MGSLAAAEVWADELCQLISDPRVRAWQEMTASSNGALGEEER
jgi:hypothetical protein